MSEFRPRQGSRKVLPSTYWLTPRPLTGSKLELHMDTGGRSLRSHHRLPYEPPPAALRRLPRSRDPATGTRDPATGTRDPVTGARDPVTGTRDPVTGTRDPAAGARNPGPDPGIRGRIQESGAGTREKRTEVVGVAPSRF